MPTPLEIWRDRLEELYSAEAVAAGFDEKYQIRKLIEEAKERIEEIEAIEEKKNSSDEALSTLLSAKFREFLGRLLKRESRVAEPPEDLELAFAEANEHDAQYCDGRSPHAKGFGEIEKGHITLGEKGFRKIQHQNRYCTFHQNINDQQYDEHAGKIKNFR